MLLIRQCFSSPRTTNPFSAWFNFGVFFDRACKAGRPALVYALCVSLASLPVQVHANPVAANAATTVYQAANGVPVTNIATPNSTGLSHNQFLSYDVDSRGLVLNNGNSSQLMRQSQLAGQTPFNPNLNKEATVILNEVVTTNRSNLAGYTEVLGGAASVIVANPNGITCAGCGFINTPNVTLTTGSPQINGSGALTGFQVNSGDILITGTGLDASSLDYLSLVTRSLRVNGQINAKDITVATGNNKWDYLTRSVTGQVPGSGPAPTYAVDSTVLGGMYANRIRIQATEAGVGVRMLGEAAASGDDFTIDSAGKLLVQSRLSAERDLKLTSTAGNADAIALDGSNLSAKNNVNLSASAGGVTLNGGVVTANNSIDVNSGTLTDTANAASVTDNNKRYAGASINITTAGAVNLDGVSYGSGGALTATAGSVNVGANGGTLYAGTTLNLTASSNLSLGSAAIQSTGDLNLTATSGVLTTAAGGGQGIQSTAGNIGINANGMTNAGSISADSGSLTMQVSNTLTNTGTVHAANGIGISDQAGGSSGTISNTGTLLSDTTLDITANTVNNSGNVQAAMGGTVVATSLTNSGSWIASTAAGSSASFTSTNLTNSGTLQSAKDLSLTVNNTLNNSGKLLATHDLSISAGNGSTTLAVSNQSGSFIQAGNALKVQGTAGASNVTLNTQAGTLLADQVDLTLSSLNNSGVIQGGAAASSITVNGALTNNSGAKLLLATVAGGSGTINADTFSNAGTVQSSGTTAMNITSALTNTGTVLSAGNMTLRGRTAAAYTVNNQTRFESQALMDIEGNGASKAVNVTVGSSGVLRSNQMAVKAATLTVADGGMVNTTGQMNLDLNTLLFGGVNSKIVAATNPSAGNDTATITLANGFSNPGVLHSGGVMTISAPWVTNTSTGGISALNTLNLSATSGDLYNVGALYAGNQLNASSSSTFTNVSNGATPQGTLDSGGSMNLSASTFINNSNINAAQNITISALTFKNEVAGGDTRAWHVTGNSGAVHDSTNSWYSFPDQYEIQNWHDTERREQYYAGGTPGFKPQIIGGNTVTVQNFATGSNMGSVISGNTINLFGNGGASFTNNDLPLSYENWTRTWEIYTHWAALGPATYDDHITRNVSGYNWSGAGGISSLGSGIYSNALNAAGLGLTNTGSPYSASVSSRNASGTSGTSLSTGVSGTVGGSAVNFGGLVITLPSNPNGYFVVSKNPNSNYLIETNPLFGVGSAMGSNYLAERLGFNLDTVQRRLGDANYENYLVRQQLIAQTGKNILQGYQDEQQQIKGLFDAAVRQDATLGLVFGKALSADQVAQLNQDMVWMVEVEVAGKKVLSPVVYLSQASRDHIQGGAVIAAKDIHMDLLSMTNTGGTIQATGTMAIVSKGDIRNTSGTISANNMALVSTDGKVINETSVTRMGDRNNYQDVADKTGAITANSNLIISGNQGVDIIGATVSAGSSAVVHSEKGDINIQSLALEGKSTTEKHTNGFLYSSSEKTVETHQTRQAASVSVGDGSNPAAQLTLLAEKGNVNLVSADLISSGGINIKANDVNASVLNLTSTKTHTSQSSGISSSGGALTIGSSSANSAEQKTIASGSNIKAGGALNVQAANNIVLEGGSYTAKTVSLDAGNDVITKAAKNTYSSSASSSSAGLTVGNGSIGIGAQADSDNTKATAYSNAQITATDGVAVNAKNKVDIGGVDIAVLTKAPAPETGAAASAVAPSAADATPTPKAAPIALGFDVAKLRSASKDGTAAQLIQNTALSGMGVTSAMADMVKPEQGQLAISGAEIVSSKFKNEFQQTTESSGTYVGIGVKAQSSDTAASAGIGVSIQNNYRKETSGEKSDNINKLAADNVSLEGSKGIDLKGVSIAGGSSVTLKSEGNINIAAAEVEKTYALDSHSTHLNIGVEASATSRSPVVNGPLSPLPSLAAPVALSANLNFGHESKTVNAQENTHADSTLSSGGTLTIQSGKGDVKFTGVTASADTLAISANNFTSAAYKDSSTRTENSNSLGVNLTASTDINKMESDLLRGNGTKTTTLNRKETAEIGNTIVANTVNIDVKNNVTLIGGNLVADDVSIKANTVDIKAAKSTLDEHKTEVGMSLTMDGSAAFMGNKAWVSADSMTGKVDSGVSQNSGLADRAGDGRVNNGKAVSDELLSGKTGLTISSKEETTKSETFGNANLQFKNLTIDTTAAAGSSKGDGHVDIGGANLLATTDASSIGITTGELKTTKYVDKTEVTSHDNSTFIGVATEAHSAIADTVNHSNTLADKAAQGMTIDPGWAAAQAAGDASNMAMGDAVGGSVAATVRNVDTQTHSVSTSENINYINAGNISIKTTQGNLALNGVEFNAPPTFNKETGAMEKATGPRPKNISLDSAKDISIKAAKSTYTETSTTLTNDVNLTASASVSGTGSGVGVDAGYNGSIDKESLEKTSYSNASVNADNVSIKAQNLNLTGANVSGGNVNVDVKNNIDIKSVQDTQTQSTMRANWGGSAGLNTMTVVSANAQGGGGDSHDNFATTAKQSGIDAETKLNVTAGGNVTLTGAHIASAGTGTVNVKGNLTVNKLNDTHEKDGLFAGGSGGISQGGINAGINLEKVDQIHNATTQNSTVSGVGLQVGGKVQGDNLQADGSLQTQATTVVKDEKIAGVYVNGTFAPGLIKNIKKAVKTAKKVFNSSKDSVVPDQPPPKKYDSAVVVVRKDKDGNIDAAVQKSVDDIKAAHPDTVVVIADKNGALEGDAARQLANIKGNTRIDVVGHGAELKELGAEKVAAMVKDVAEQIDKNSHETNVKRVEIVACGTCTKDGETTLGQQVTQKLARENLEVAEHNSPIQVQADGTRVAKQGVGAKKLISTYNDKNGVKTVSRAKRDDELVAALDPAKQLTFTLGTKPVDEDAVDTDYWKNTLTPKVKTEAEKKANKQKMPGHDTDAVLEVIKEMAKSETDYGKLTYETLVKQAIGRLPYDAIDLPPIAEGSLKGASHQKADVPEDVNFPKLYRSNSMVLSAPNPKYNKIRRLRDKDVVNFSIVGGGEYHKGGHGDFVTPHGPKIGNEYGPLFKGMQDSYSGDPRPPVQRNQELGQILLNMFTLPNDKFKLEDIPNKSLAANVEKMYAIMASAEVTGRSSHNMVVAIAAFAKAAKTGDSPSDVLQNSLFVHTDKKTKHKDLGGAKMSKSHHDGILDAAESGNAVFKEIRANEYQLLADFAMANGVDVRNEKEFGDFLDRVTALGLDVMTTRFDIKDKESKAISKKKSVKESEGESDKRLRPDPNAMETDSDGVNASDQVERMEEIN